MAFDLYMNIQQSCSVAVIGCVLQGVLQRELGMMWEFFSHDCVRSPLNPSLEVIGVDRKVRH